MSNSLVDDEGVLLVRANPLWPSSHMGYVYAPLDTAWRRENPEWYQGLIKLTSGLTIYQKESARHVQQLQQQLQQGGTEISDHLFADTAGFIGSFDESRQRPLDQTAKFVMQYQTRILENLAQNIQGGSDGGIGQSQQTGEQPQREEGQKEHRSGASEEVIRSQPLANMGSVRLNGLQLGPDLEFTLALIQQYNGFLDQRELALKSAYNYRAELNGNYLDAMEAALIRCVELASKQLRNYSGTAVAPQETKSKRYFFPVPEPAMLRCPVLKPYLQYQLYLANVLRQNGKPEEALRIYRMLVNVSLPQQQNVTVPSIFTMMGASSQPRQALPYQPTDIPDARIPFLCGLLAAGRGMEAQAVLERGVKCMLPDDAQGYLGQNICRAQSFFGAQPLLSGIQYCPDAMNIIGALEGKTLSNRYTEALGMINLQHRLKVVPRCACCSGYQEDAPDSDPFYPTTTGSFTGTAEDAFCHTGNNADKYANGLAGLPPAVRPGASFFAGCQACEKQARGRDEARAACSHEQPVLNANVSHRNAPSGQKMSLESFRVEETATLALQMKQSRTQLQKNRANQLLQDCPEVEQLAALLTKEQAGEKGPPVSRRMFYGSYFGANERAPAFNFKDLLQQGLQTSPSQCALMVASEFIQGPRLLQASALYSYILVLLSKRIAWANLISKLIFKQRQLGMGCNCGLGLHSVPQRPSAIYIAQASGQSCGFLLPQQQNDNISAFVRTLLLKYPPPKLPSLALLEAAFRTNPLIAEFLLSVRRLPDVCSQRQQLICFSEASQQERQSRAGHKTPYLALSIQQQLVMEAALYTSDFGHFWQADELAFALGKQAMKLQTILEGSGQFGVKYAYHSWLRAETLKEALPYAGLDFLREAYGQYINHGLLRLLQQQIVFNQTYYEQMGQLTIASGGQLANQSVQDSEEALRIISDGPPSYLNQFGVPDTVFNLQNANSFKANVYACAFDRHVGSYSQELRGISIYEQALCGFQRASLRFIGDLLAVIPKAETFQIFKELTRYFQQKKIEKSDVFTAASVATALQQSIQKILPDFAGTLLQKTKTQKIKAKEKEKTKTKAVPEADKAKMQVEPPQVVTRFDGFVLDDENGTDNLWDTIKGNPPLCVNFAINQALAYQNAILSSQLLNAQGGYDITPGQPAILSPYQQIQELTGVSAPITTFNVFLNLYGFVHLLLSKFMFTGGDMSTLLRDEGTQTLVNAMSVYGLGKHLLAFYQVLLQQRQALVFALSQQLPDQAGQRITKASWDRSLQFVEKVSGFGRHEYVRPKDPQQELLVLQSLAQFHTQNVWPQYFVMSGQKTTPISSAIIFASTPPQFYTSAQMAEAELLLPNNSPEKTQRLSILLRSLDKFIAQDMAAHYTPLEVGQYRELTPLYLAVLSGDSETLFALLQNHEPAFFELLQAIQLACISASPRILALLTNKASDAFQGNPTPSGLNVLRNPSIQINQDAVSALEQNEWKALELAQIMAVHQVFTSHMGTQEGYSGMPLFWEASQSFDAEEKYQIFKSKPQKQAYLKTLREVSAAVSESLWVQFHLIYQLCLSGAAFCTGNECLSCRIYKGVAGPLGFSDKSARCVVHQQILRQAAQEPGAFQGAQTQFQTQQYIQQQISLGIQQCFLALLQFTLTDFKLVYLAGASAKHGSQPPQSNGDSAAPPYQPDYLEAKCKDGPARESLKAPTHLSTPLTLAAQCNSELLPVLVACLRQDDKQKAEPAQKQPEAAPMPVNVAYLNHMDGNGLTAAHHAALIFIRTGQQMLIYQESVDKFNQLGSQKISTAKNIQSAKLAFRQAAQNLREILSAPSIQTFIPDKQGLNLRDRIVLFLFQNQLLTGHGIQVLQQALSLVKQCDGGAEQFFPTELILASLTVHNDTVVKTQCDALKEQSRATQKRFSLSQTQADSQKLVARKARLKACFTSIMQEKAPRQNQIVTLFKNQAQTLNGDTFAVGINLQAHQSVLKGSGDAPYAGSDLLKTVLLEVLDVLRCMLLDESGPCQSNGTYGQYCAMSQAVQASGAIKIKNLGASQPSAQNPLGFLPGYAQEEVSGGPEIVDFQQFESREKPAKAAGAQQRIEQLECQLFGDADAPGRNNVTQFHADSNVFSCRPEPHVGRGKESAGTTVTQAETAQESQRQKALTLQREETPLYCTRMNILRYSNRLWRQPAAESRTLADRRIDAGGHAILSELQGMKSYKAKHLIGKMGGLAKLDRHATEDDLFAWRKAILRTINHCSQRNALKISGPRADIHLCLADCVRIAELVEVFFKPLDLFESPRAVDPPSQQAIGLTTAIPKLSVVGYDTNPKLPRDSYIRRIRTVFEEVAVRSGDQTTDVVIAKSKEGVEGAFSLVQARVSDVREIGEGFKVCSEEQ